MSELSVHGLLFDSTMDTPNYARQAFDQSLRNLEHDVLEMGSLAEQMVIQAVESLCQLDHQMAVLVMKADDEIDERDLEIEAQCLRILALQNPTGSDLRAVGTAMKMIVDIERIGDLSVDLAKCGLKIEKELGSTSFIDVKKIGVVAQSMLVEALESYVKKDLDQVQRVCKKDDDVDDLYRQLRGQIHDHMKKNPDEVVSASWLLLAIHHIERIADHAVNIAERVHFMITGSFEQIASSHKSDAPNPS